MHIDRVKGSFRNLKTEDVRTVADEGDGWIPSRKKNVTAEGAQDRVYLVVLVGTGAHLGQTRVELYAELQDGTETHAVPVDALNELNLFYGVGEIRTRQEYMNRYGEIYDQMMADVYRADVIDAEPIRGVPALGSGT